MAISNRTIISRMQRELQALQGKAQSEHEVQQRIGNVKLMCELLLENSTTEESGGIQPQQSALEKDVMQKLEQTPDMTEEEYNVMIKGKDAYGVEHPNNILKGKTQKKNDLTDHEDANGESIFDF